MNKELVRKHAISAINIALDTWGGISKEPEFEDDGCDQQVLEYHQEYMLHAEAYISYLLAEGFIKPVDDEYYLSSVEELIEDINIL